MGTVVLSLGLFLGFGAMAIIFFLLHISESIGDMANGVFSRPISALEESGGKEKRGRKIKTKFIMGCICLLIAVFGLFLPSLL